MVTAAATPEQVRAAIDAVPDPEMPQISVGQLGMVVDVRVRERDVEVDLVATYSSCPATRWIADDVRAAVEGLHGVASARVVFVRDVVWTPQRITAEGRAALRAGGIAPPGEAPLVALAPEPPSWWEAGEAPAVPCPFCGSTDTRLDSPFGPTPCRAVHWCAACRNPFEAVRA